jgi:hypothetical protein
MYRLINFGAPETICIIDRGCYYQNTTDTNTSYHQNPYDQYGPALYPPGFHPVKTVGLTVCVYQVFRVLVWDSVV